MTKNEIINRREIKILLVYTLAIALIVLGNKLILQNSSYQPLHVYPIPETKYLTLGHTNTISDILWVKFLQDGNYCENTGAEKSYNSGKNLEEILSHEMKSSRCNLGWTFQILNFLTDLSPMFYDAYVIGGTALDIGVDDREGAKIIFDKGLKKFPDDWVLNYRASYLYLFELQDPHRAAQLLMNAYRHGGPDFLPTLAARLYDKAGKAIIGKAILTQFIKEHPNSDVVAHAKERLKEIEKDLQH